MGFWPFGGAKKNRTNSSTEKARILDPQPTVQPRTTMTEKSYRADATPRSPATKQSPELPRKPSYNNEKTHRTSTSRNSSRPQTTSPTTKDAQNTSSQTANESGRRDSSNKPSKLKKQNIYQQDVRSNNSLGPENFSALRPTPTLRARRSDYDSNVSRAKSSKRKAEEYAREREIRAMSQPIPIPKRPATYSGADGPLRRDTKAIPGDLNRRLERPPSLISLPLPESISEAEDMSQQNSFKVGLLAALGPRPTVKYDASRRTSLGKRRLEPKPSLRDIIHEEDPSSLRRIDDLADDLDSQGLRELMEKDRKRREKKRDLDKNKLMQKLERRAERQRADEERRSRRDEPISPSPSRAGQPAGLGIDSNPPSSPIPETPQQGDMRSVPEPSSIDGAPEVSTFSQSLAVLGQTKSRSPIRNPFEDEMEDERQEDPFSHPDDPEPEPVLPVRSPLRVAKQIDQPPQQLVQPQTISPPSSPIAQPQESSVIAPIPILQSKISSDVSERDEPDRRASDQNSGHMSSWTTFFKRGGRRKRGSFDPGRATPEFSNTSRESFSKRNPPPIVPPRSYRRTESSTPQRTLSRFREDLPELPLSPPDSRVQSPEAAAAPSSVLTNNASRKASQSLTGTLDDRSLMTSSSIPALDRGRPDTSQTEKRSMDFDSATPGHPVVTVAQSLASVDSEGSWLSGKPVKRISAQSYHGQRASQSSLQPRASPAIAQAEEHEVTNDEYFKRLAPAPDERPESSITALRKASSGVIDPEQMNLQPVDTEAPLVPDRSDERWHGSVGRQPQVIRQASRARSKEGLLKQYNAEEVGSSQASSDVDDDDEASIHGGEPSPGEQKDSSILRAKSVEYKGHARHISAGSARLLDIRRASTVSERSGHAGDSSNRMSTSRLSAAFRSEDKLASEQQ